MRVFLTGASGVLGLELVRQLAARGHSVVGAVRSDRSKRVLDQLGAMSQKVDLFDPDALARAAQGCEVVIHAATAIPTKARPVARDWRMNDLLRREGTEALTECAARIGARAYLQQSIAWLARPLARERNHAPYDETSPPRPDSITQSALDGERIAAAAGERHGYSATVLRCGFFYGAAAAHTRQFAERLRKRQFPVIGQGAGRLNLLHVEDAAAAFVAAAEQPSTGLWHVVDDEPVTLADFLGEFARQLSAPPPRHAPVWLARLFAGKSAVEFLNSPAWTTNASFRRDFSWQPRYPTFREGLGQIIHEWKNHDAST